MATVPQLLTRPLRKRKERYRLLKLIGQGGTGAVYKAEDLELDRIIAVKLLHPMLAGNERYVNLLKREVVVASQITHPNIVRVFDVSNLRNSPIITMAFIQGENLASILHRDGALSTPRIVHFGRQICSALEEAHRRGVVHRDLKPQNLLVDHQSQIYISDFGLAHVSSLANHEAIESSSRPGTLRYMSPEQFHALPCDPRSDIFSFGLILFEMLTGSALEIDHNSTGPIAIDRKTGRAVAFADEVSATLAAIALRCMAQNPGDRYQSASEILASFPRECFAVEGIPKCPAYGWNRLRNHPHAALAGATSLALLVAMCFWWSWHSHKFFASASFDQLYRDASSELQKEEDVRSLERAAALFQSAAALNPVEIAFEGIAKAELHLYQLEADRQRLTPARAAVQQMEKLNGKSRSAALLHAEIEMAEGAPAAAAARLQRLLASERPSDEVLRLLAKAQLVAGQSSEAVASWNGAVGLNPNYWPNHNGFGAALIKLGRPEEAQAEFRKVIQLAPESYVGYTNLGAAYVALGEFRKAIAVTDKSLTLRATAKQYNNLGSALYYTGSPHSSIQLFLKAVELNPRSELYQSNLGEAYRCVGQTAQAEAAYVKAVQLAQEGLRESPGNARLIARLAVSLAKTGRTNEAKAQLSLALAGSPGNPEILYSKAQLALVQHQYAEGAAAVREALDQGYPIKVAARDPEIMPLWADPELKKRFKSELSRGSAANEANTW